LIASAETTFSAAPGSAAPHALRFHAGSRLGVFVALGALLAVFVPGRTVAPFLLAYNALLAALYGWDRARLKRAALTVVRAQAGVRATRARTLRWFARESLDYTLSVELVQGPPLRLTIEECPPASFTIVPPRWQTRVAKGEAVELDAQIHAARHESARLSHVFVRRESRLGLCAVVEAHPALNELRAYPRLPRGHEAFSARALDQAGNNPKPRHSAQQGGEIERLREYVVTDPMRSIDWKASAKRHRPITRAYQPERSQTLWIGLDASRGMMTHSDGSLADGTAARTRFESALEAALVLAAAALAEGDCVGLLVYGRSLSLAVPARRGRAHLYTLVDAALAVHAEATELDAAGLLASFTRHAPKRSLFVFFTDLDNGADLQQLAEHAPLLTRRHLALCVSLNEHNQASRRPSAIEGERDVYRRVAQIHLNDERARLKQNLQNGGLGVIESQLPDLAHAALAEYQRQKRAGRL
jgi:uncharacterized protein (DUF58 family)